MFYHIVTYGCQMNIHESEKLAGALDDLGYVSCDNEQTADVIIFNTCAIREGAENRAIGNIGALKSLKKDKPELIIAVCGCMTQQQSAANYIYKTFPFVDIIFGTHDIEKFSSFLKNRLSTKQRIISHEKDNPKIWEDYHALRTSGENAWVNIMQGCNNFCSYCIVPFVRGREKSRTKEHIFAEIKKLIETKKYKTITLLGQNVNSYGHDLYEDYSFANLLKDICEIEGDFKLKFMTSHPKDISDDVINILASKDKLAKELHLPVQ
ncbi:MAG: MiaB/RimO family radical SAM methylthiotransferase, partial [Clostridia bacterium]